MPSEKSSEPLSSTRNTPNVYFRQASSNDNRITLNDVPPGNVVTMDLAEMAIMANAQADGSEEAVCDASLILDCLLVLKKAHTQFELRPMLYQESNLNFERL
jgi:hypothetical protein